MSSLFLNPFFNLKIIFDINNLYKFVNVSLNKKRPFNSKVNLKLKQQKGIEKYKKE